MADTMIEIVDDIFEGNVHGIYGNTGVFAGNQTQVEEIDDVLLGALHGVYSGGVAFSGNAKEVSEIDNPLLGGLTLPWDGWNQTFDRFMGEIFQGATYPKAGDNMRLIDYLEDPKPEADFTSNRVDGIAPFAVQFIDTSTNNPIAWKWNFGDGHVSNAQNPVHSFSLPGKYSITLRVYTYTQSDLTIKFDYILAGILDFNADHTSGPVKLKCRFNAEIVLP